MIKARTYNGVAGLNYIQSADLAFATIYVVKKNGTQYDEYISGDANRRFIFNNSQGKIYFPDLFEDSAKVYVLFKSVGGSDTCEMVNILDYELPDAIEGVFYSESFTVLGTELITLNVIAKPSWASVGLTSIAPKRLIIKGFPDTPGSETLQVELTNCGGVLPITKTFETLANSNNINITAALNSSIINVTGISYVISSGSFPVNYGEVVSGIHSGYSGAISVAVTNIVFFAELKIYKNGVIQETITISANGTYMFAPIVFLSTDQINITL